MSVVALDPVRSSVSKLLTGSELDYRFHHLFDISAIGRLEGLKCKEKEESKKLNKSNKAKHEKKITKESQAFEKLKELIIPELELYPNPSPFGVYSSVRRIVLGDQLRRVSELHLESGRVSAGLVCEDDDEIECEANSTGSTGLSANKLPKVVGLGLCAVFELIRDTHVTHPVLCARALQALFDVLQGLPPEALSNEPRDAMDAMYHLLMEICNSRNGGGSGGNGGGVGEGEGGESLSGVACSCMISQVVARGDTGKILTAITSMLMYSSKLATQQIKIPKILTSLQRSVYAVMTGRTALPDWLNHGFTIQSRVCSVAINEIESVGDRVAMTSDGQYLYVHNGVTLYKIGTGYANTILGNVYATSSSFNCKGAGAWLSVVKGKLLFRVLSDSHPVLTVINTTTLQASAEVRLEGRINGSNILFSDGEYICEISSSKDESFIFRSYDTSRTPLSVVTELPLKLARKYLQVYGAAVFDSIEDLHNTDPLLDDIVSVVSGKEFALTRTSAGKVLYAGKSQAVGIKAGGGEGGGGGWRELGMVKSPRITQVSVGHEGTHALLINDEGNVFFVGTAKRGEDGDSHSLGKARRQARAVKPKKMIRVEGKNIITSACNNGSSAVVSSEGEVFLYGKDTQHCDRLSGLLSGLRGIVVTSICLGKAHGALLTSMGHVYTFGLNNKGQCGRDYVTAAAAAAAASGSTAAGGGAVGGASKNEEGSVMRMADDGEETEDEIICAPGNHRWEQQQCMICTQCYECTGYGSACISSARPDRSAGQPCGCGAGDSGCAECGCCKTCAGERGREEGEGFARRAPDQNALFGNAAMMNAIDWPLYPMQQQILQQVPQQVPLDLFMGQPKAEGAGRAGEGLRRIIGRHKGGKNKEGRGGGGEGGGGVIGSDVDQEAMKLASLSPGRVLIGAREEVCAVQISCGLHHTVVVMENGDVYTFGSNQYGQLGLSDTTLRGSPCQMKMLSCKQVSAGSNHTVLLSNSGLVYTCGSHKKGQLGRPVEENEAAKEKKTCSAWSPHPIPDLGPRHGKSVVWIGASGDHTVIRLDESLINTKTLNNSYIIANSSSIGLLPSADIGQSSVRCLMISRQDGGCRSYFGSDQLSAVGCTVCLDPLHDVLWRLGGDNELVCYHAIAGEMKGERWGGMGGVMRDLLTPQRSLPVRASNFCTRSHCAINMLGCLDILSVARRGGVGVREGEEDKPAPNLVLSREDYSVVNRFESHGGGWGYSGHSIEAIRFSCDTDVLLGGFGLFGGRGEYFGKIKLFELGADAGDNEPEGEQICETDEMPYRCAAREKFCVMFDEPVLIQSNHWYVAWARISGPSSDCGSSGQTSVTTDDGVVFKFRSSKKSNNGTDANAGQIPQLLYRLPSMYLPSHSAANKLNGRSGDNLTDYIHILSHKFYSTISPECFESLSGLLSWSWSTFCSLGGDLRQVKGKNVRAALLDLQQLVYITTASLRLIQTYILELYPSADMTHTPLMTQKETPRLAECVGEVRLLLRQILTESARFHGGARTSLEDGGIKFDELCAAILDECHVTFTSCFHAFYPTSNLKWVCLCDLLTSLDLTRDKRDGLGRMLSAVLEALCHPSIKLINILPLSVSLESTDSIDLKQLQQSDSSADDNCVSTAGSVAVGDPSCSYPMLVGHMIHSTEMNFNQQAIFRKPADYVQKPSASDSSADDNCVSTAGSVAVGDPSCSYPMLVGHMIHRTEMELVGRGVWAFKDILNKLIHITTHPIKQALVQERQTLSSSLVYNTCCLLVAVLGELTASASGTEVEVTMSSRPLLTTPPRFSRTSQGAYWNTGNGSPDAVCFHVDKPGVMVAGIKVYVGSGAYEYEVELLCENDKVNDLSPNGRWNSLELVKGSFIADDLKSDTFDVKFSKPVPIKEEMKYAIRLRNRGQRTRNGDGGQSKVKGTDGTTFTFTSCALSSNGTNQSRGQIPNILYYCSSSSSVDDVGEGFVESSRQSCESLARKSLFNIITQIFSSATELLQSVSCLDSQSHDEYMKILEESSVFSTLLPMTAAYVGPVACRHPAGAVEVLSLIQQILPIVSRLNSQQLLQNKPYAVANQDQTSNEAAGKVKPSSVAAGKEAQASSEAAGKDKPSNESAAKVSLSNETAAEAADKAKPSSETAAEAAGVKQQTAGESSDHHYAVIESDHPYKSGTITTYKVKFPEGVRWMVLEFDPSCGTSQPEDYLQLYLPLISPAAARSSSSAGPAAVKPSPAAAKPGSVAGPARKLGSAARPGSSDKLSAAESDDMSSWYPVMKKYHMNDWPVNALVLPGREVCFSLETASDYLKDEGACRYGFKCTVIGYEWSSTVTQGLTGLELELTSLAGSCAISLMRTDVLSQVALSEAERNIRTTDPSFIQLYKQHTSLLNKGFSLPRVPSISEALEGNLPISVESNEKTFLMDFINCVPGTSGGRLASWLQPDSYVDVKRCGITYSKEDVWSGLPVNITVHIKDQYGNPVIVPNLLVEVTATPMLGDKTVDTEGGARAQDDSVTYGGEPAPRLDVKYQITMKDNRDKYHAITMMKAYEHYSFEELRLAAPARRRAVERMLIREQSDGTYCTTWTPASSGLYNINITIDHINTGEVFKIEVKKSLQGLVPPVTDSSKKIISQSNKMRRFVAVQSAGLRVRLHPTLQSEQIGIIKPNDVISFTSEVHNTDGIWLRLSVDSIKSCCHPLNGFTEGWALQYNKHLGKTFLVPVDPAVEDNATVQPPVAPIEGFIRQPISVGHSAAQLHPSPAARSVKPTRSKPVVYRIISCGQSGHNIRAQPHLLSPPIGMVVNGNELTAIKQVESGEETWLLLDDASTQRYCSDTEGEAWCLARSGDDRYLCCHSDLEPTAQVTLNPFRAGGQGEGKKWRGFDFSQAATIPSLTAFSLPKTSMAETELVASSSLAGGGRERRVSISSTPDPLGKSRSASLRREASQLPAASLVLPGGRERRKSDVCRVPGIPDEYQGVPVKELVKFLGESRVNGNGVTPPRTPPATPKKVASRTPSPHVAGVSGAGLCVGLRGAADERIILGSTVIRNNSAHSPYARSLSTGLQTSSRHQASSSSCSSGTVPADSYIRSLSLSPSRIKTDSAPIAAATAAAAADIKEGDGKIKEIFSIGFSPPKDSHRHGVGRLGRKERTRGLRQKRDQKSASPTPACPPSPHTTPKPQVTKEALSPSLSQCLRTVFAAFIWHEGIVHDAMACASFLKFNLSLHKPPPKPPHKPPPGPNTGSTASVGGASGAAKYAGGVSAAGGVASAAVGSVAAAVGGASAAVGGASAAGISAEAVVGGASALTNGITAAVEGASGIVNGAIGSTGVEDRYEGRNLNRSFKSEMKNISGERSRPKSDILEDRSALKYDLTGERTSPRPDVSNGSSLPLTLRHLVTFWDDISAETLAIVRANLIQPPSLFTESSSRDSCKSDQAGARVKKNKDGVGVRGNLFGEAAAAGALGGFLGAHGGAVDKEIVCELCGAVSAHPVTYHMRQRHPGCGVSTEGKGYNSGGNYCGGWAGNCGDGGTGGSTWYLMCEACRNRYLRDKKPVRAKGTRDHKKSLKRRSSPGKVRSSVWQTAESHVIIKNNAMFVLQLASAGEVRLPGRGEGVMQGSVSSDRLGGSPRADESVGGKERILYLELCGVSEQDGSDINNEEQSSVVTAASRTRARPKSTYMNLNEVDKLSEMISRGDEGRSFQRSMSEVTGLEAKHTSMRLNMTDNIHDANIDLDDGKIEDDDDDCSLLVKRPSSALLALVERQARARDLQKTIGLDLRCRDTDAAISLAAGGSRDCDDVYRPILMFCSQRHDLEELELSIRLSLRRAVCRVHALQTFRFLLCHVSRDICLHDVLWSFISSLSDHDDNYDDTDGKVNDVRKGTPGNNDADLQKGLVIASHPSTDVLLGGEGAVKPVNTALHAFLQGVASVTMYLPPGSALQQAAVQCWAINFTSTDHAFLHRSRVFSNISNMLSKSEDDCDTENTLLTRVGRVSDIASPRKQPNKPSSTSSNDKSAVVYRLEELTPGSEVKASSRQAMIGSLLDGSTETFWESGEEDKNRNKSITITCAHGRDASVVFVHIDNVRDVANKVGHVIISAGSTPDDLTQILAHDLDLRHAGWINCWFSAAPVVRVELKGPDNSLRVRQVRVLGGPGEACAGGGVGENQRCEGMALKVFRQLTNQVFGRLICESGVGNVEGRGGEEGVEEDGMGSYLREHMVGILFSRSGLTQLQRQVCAHIVKAIHRETEQVRRAWEESLKGGEEGAREDTKGDGYVFELLSLVLALSGSVTGRRYLSQQHSLVLDLLILLHVSTPRVQRQVLSLLRRVLLDVSPRVLSCLLNVPPPPHDYSILSSPGGGRVTEGRLLDLFLACICKALTVQIKTKSGTGGRAQTSSHVMSDYLGQSGDPWYMKGQISGQVAESMIGLLKDLTSDSVTEEWGRVSKSLIAQPILELMRYDKASRQPGSCLNSNDFWLTLASLCVLTDEHVTRLSSSPSSLQILTEEAEGVSKRATCSNHDDSVTLAVILCSECGNLCADCDRVLHLNRRMRAHQRQVFKEEEESIRVDRHEGCGRVKLFWLLALADTRTLKAVAEFRVSEVEEVEIGGGEACRFCGTAVDTMMMSVEDSVWTVCCQPDCQSHARSACTRTLPCGHSCGGVRGEVACLPCLRGCSGDAALKQDGDDMCMICFTDALSTAPAVLLECGHAFHVHCVRAVLQRRWSGPRITFGFAGCAICKSDMIHESIKELTEPIFSLREDVRRKALLRMQYEGKDGANSLKKYSSEAEAVAHAMTRYAYYVCSKCGKAYYGGEVRCEEERGAGEEERFDPSELVCGACSDVAQAQICPRHGTDFLEYKCRYCCSVAVFFCFGTTHFCNACHDDFQRVTSMSKSELPHCPAGPRGRQLEDGTECPLHVVHPPTGEEFALGCAICRNAHTF